jgi:tetratricopeptide (TPR) repeat protein
MSGNRENHENDPRGRTEPTLGDIDRLDAPAPAPASDGLPQVTVEPRVSRTRTRASAPPSAPGRRGWLMALLLLVFVALVGTVWFKQNDLRNMLPRTELNDVLSRAHQALQDGRLDGQDGTSARELYQAAVALEPDNDAARNGLHQVGRAELSQGDTALQAGQLDQAAQHAAVARELLGGGSDIDRLDRAIEKARAAHLPTDDLVDRARQALAAGRLDGDQGAGPLYLQVLRANPGNAVAAHGLNQVGDALAEQARKALDAQHDSEAAALIDRLAALLPNHGALPALRAQQAQQRQQHSDALDEAIKQGRTALAEGRISGPGDDTALAHFKAALALDPDSSEARSGLGLVAQALIVRANAAIDAGDSTQAAGLLDQAAALAPKSADLAAARARIGAADAASSPPSETAAPQAAAEPDDAGLVSPTLSAAQQEQIAQLLQRAQAAATRGDIMLPPGESAYDLYRQALAIDGNDVVARRGLQALPVQVRQQFNQALAAGQLGRATDMLANLAELAPGDPAQGALGNRLANAWLDQADRQLASGDRVGAAQSLNRARKLTPDSARVQDMAVRLQGGP